MKQWLTSIVSSSTILPVSTTLKQKFHDRIGVNSSYTREEDPQDHFCAYFLPITRKLDYIYLVHHIKANKWIPPGGHIETGEHPLDTVKREINEELAYIIPEGSDISLLTLTLTKIDNPKISCTFHWDLWFQVFCPKIDFTFDTGEFHAAKWVSLQQASKIANYAANNHIFHQLIEHYS